MRLDIEIGHFRSVQDQVLPIDGLVILFGPNSAGKTSVLEAAAGFLDGSGFVGGDTERNDPGLDHGAVPEGKLGYRLPGAAVSGSPDAELFRVLLNGTHAGEDWAWSDLAPDAADILKGMNTDEAQEWIASRLADSGSAGTQPDRYLLARAILNPDAVYFIDDYAEVAMVADASRLAPDDRAAARRLADGATSDPDLLCGIASHLASGTDVNLGAVAEGWSHGKLFPPVTVLDGDIETLSTALARSVEVIHDRMWDFGEKGYQGPGSLGDLALHFPPELVSLSSRKSAGASPVSYVDDRWARSAIRFGCSSFRVS